MNFFAKGFVNLIIQDFINWRIKRFESISPFLMLSIDIVSTKGNYSVIDMHRWFLINDIFHDNGEYIYIIDYSLVNGLYMLIHMLSLSTCPI